MVRLRELVLQTLARTQDECIKPELNFCIDFPTITEPRIGFPNPVPSQFRSACRCIQDQLVGTLKYSVTFPTYESAQLRVSELSQIAQTFLTKLPYRAEAVANKPSLRTIVSFGIDSSVSVATRDTEINFDYEAFDKACLDYLKYEICKFENLFGDLTYGGWETVAPDESYQRDLNTTLVRVRDGNYFTDDVYYISEKNGELVFSFAEAKFGKESIVHYIDSSDPIAVQNHLAKMRGVVNFTRSQVLSDEKGYDTIEVRERKGAELQQTLQALWWLEQQYKEKAS